MLPNELELFSRGAKLIGSHNSESHVLGKNITLGWKLVIHEIETQLFYLVLSPGVLSFQNETQKASSAKVKGHELF